MIFSCQFPDVSFGSVGDYAAVVITIAGTEVFRETLYPGSSGLVIEDLRSMVEPYARQQLVVTVNIAAECENGSNYNRTATVLYSTVDIGDELTAEEFYTGHFLSLLQGPKLTALGRLEVLNFYGAGTATVTAYYDDDTTDTFTALVTGGSDSYTHLNVSPSQYVATGKTLLSYTVTAGSRQQVYHVMADQPDTAPIFCFVNSFGVEEMVYFTGLHEVDPSYERKQTRIGRMLQTFKLTETRNFTGDSGPLTPAMADWIDDLLRSDEIRICNVIAGVVRPGKEVVISDSKSHRTNDHAELPRISVTYQYAQRNHNVMQLQRAGRIFDNTFDDTFN